MPFHGYANRTDVIVCWPVVGTAANGQPVVSDVAEERECWWDSTTRTVTGPDGEPRAVDATVGGLETELPVGSAVWKGTIEDIPGTGQVPTQDVMRVLTSTEERDVRGRSSAWVVTLYRAKDALGQTGAAGG